MADVQQWVRVDTEFRSTDTTSNDKLGSLVRPTPNTGNFLITATQSLNSNVVKSASPDIVIFNDQEIEANAEAMVDLLFENIGGQELLQIARYDTVNGQEVLYQPIKNLNIIQEEYNPNNILKLQKTSDRIFGNFPIKIDPTTPDDVVADPDTIEDSVGNVYLDKSGNVVIEITNLEGNEQVEVEITRNGTIYSIDLLDN
jgi:hypothetical protein